MSQLSILAVQNAAVLRYLDLPDDERGPTVADAARRLERDESNLRKTFKVLEASGLMDATRHLTAEGRAQLAAIDRAEGKPGSSDALPADHVAAVHAQLMPDPDNARKDWDSPEAVADLAELAESIDQSGLLQNPMVKVAPDAFQLPGQPPIYMLDGGERRWRAIGHLIADGRWPAERQIICRLIETDDLGHRLAALAENMQRRNLNPLEKAKAFEGLAEALTAQGVAADKINREIADRVGVTIEHVQQHRSFLKLDEEDQQRLALPKDDTKRLSVRDARQKVADVAKREAARAELEAVPMEQRLTLAEILHRISVAGTYSWDSVVIRPGFAESELGQALKGRDWVRFEGPIRYGEEKLGQYVVSRGYGVPHDIAAPFWSGTADDREAELRRWQGLAGHPGRTDYVTEWLNGPFDRSPEGQEIHDAEIAARQEREAAQQEAEATRAEKLAQQEAAQQRASVAAARTRELYAAHRSAPPPAPALVELAELAGAKLPWRRMHNGDVVAADGEVIISGRSEWAEARMRLVILAINAAAGLETPEDEPDPNPELDEAAFVEALDLSLRTHGVEVDLSGEDVLAEFLSGNGVAFGDDGWDWTAEGAERLAVEALADAGEDDDQEEAA